MRPSPILARLGLAPLLGLLTAAAPPMTFIPLGPVQAPAAAEYRAIWEAEGPAIVNVLEGVTGLVFPSDPIEVIVSNGQPMTSYDGRTMRLRGLYPPLYKRATLIHELGHRLAFTLPNRAGLSDHHILNLFLYDAWSDLYGKPFADRMVAVEKRITGPGDYRSAWDWALSMSRDQRRTQFAALRGPPRLRYEDVLGEAELAEPPRRLRARPRAEPPERTRPSGEVEGMR